MTLGDKILIVRIIKGDGPGVIGPHTVGLRAITRFCISYDDSLAFRMRSILSSHECDCKHSYFKTFIKTSFLKTTLQNK